LTGDFTLSLWRRLEREVHFRLLVDLQREGRGRTFLLESCHLGGDGVFADREGGRGEYPWSLVVATEDGVGAGVCDFQHARRAPMAPCGSVTLPEIEPRP